MIKYFHLISNAGINPKFLLDNKFNPGLRENETNYVKPIMQFHLCVTSLRKNIPFQ